MFETTNYNSEIKFIINIFYNNVNVQESLTHSMQ